MDHTHHDHHRDHQQSYTCPMHPEVIKPAPGECPKCGMDLVQVERKANKQDTISFLTIMLWHVLTITSIEMG